jgi:hypothetical protein
VHQPKACQYFEAVDIQLQHTYPLPALLTGLVKFMHVKLVYGSWPNQTSFYKDGSLNLSSNILAQNCHANQTRKTKAVSRLQ